MAEEDNINFKDFHIDQLKQKHLSGNELPDDDFRMSGAGRGAGTDPLTPQDLTPQRPTRPPMSAALTNYMSSIG